MLVLTTPPTVSVRFTVYFIAPDSHLKCLSGQLLLQYQTNSLYTWQKFSSGVEDVQDANFVKILSRVNELLPLILLKKKILVLTCFF